MEWIFESERLGFRKLTGQDFTALYQILGDQEIMYAWEHGFSEDEVREWIEKNIDRYKVDGFSYFAAIEKDSGTLIGVIGPLVEWIEGEPRIGLAYILDKVYWGKGFAVEGVKASMEYAFDELGADAVIAEIRPENKRSCNVAQRVGMTVESQFVKMYQGKEMLHLIYSKRR